MSQLLLLAALTIVVGVKAIRIRARHRVDDAGSRVVRHRCRSRQRSRNQPRHGRRDTVSNPACSCSRGWWWQPSWPQPPQPSWRQLAFRWAAALPLAAARCAALRASAAARCAAFLAALTCAALAPVLAAVNDDRCSSKRLERLEPLPWTHCHIRQQSPARPATRERTR